MVVIHLSGGERLGHTVCDLPSPRYVTGNHQRATCSTCLLKATQERQNDG